MGLACLVLELGATEASALSDALLDAGALSVSAEDALAGTPAEIPVYDEFGTASPDMTDWPMLRLRVLVDGKRPPGELLADAVHAAGLASIPEHATEALEDEDWVRKTQSQFEPIAITPRLWIIPSWHTPPDPTAINIALDPGIAFGTGSHPTTRLCLRWLERHVRSHHIVLDYGCGSGILAIAAARLGAAHVIGVDIDPAAVASARDNAVRNGITAEFSDAAEPLDLEADLLVANILANPLKMLAPALAAHTASGGRLALAGVLVPQQAEVEAAYAAWFDFEPGVEDEGWICLSARRR